MVAAITFWNSLVFRIMGKIFLTSSSVCLSFLASLSPSFSSLALLYLILLEYFTFSPATVTIFQQVYSTVHFRLHSPNINSVPVYLLLLVSRVWP